MDLSQAYGCQKDNTEENKYLKERAQAQRSSNSTHNGAKFPKKGTLPCGKRKRSENPYHI